jgi:hypothetical protein
VNLVDFDRLLNEPAAGRRAGVMPVTGASSTTTARSCGSLADFANAGSAYHVPACVLPVAELYEESKVTATRLSPRSQCAAVEKTVGEIRVPVHSAHVPSEKATGARRAPTSG